MSITNIEWCCTPLPDGTLIKGYSGNPWLGCHKVSPGCKNCYAESDTPARVRRAKGLEIWGPKAPRPEVKGFWDEVPRWDRRAQKLGIPLKHFVGSNCDIFEGRADLDAMRARLWALLESTPHLIHILVTKRPENVLTLIPGGWRTNPWPSNIWLLTSVEDQQRAEERIPHLLQVPATVRGVSYEPALGPVDFARWMPRRNCEHPAVRGCDCCHCVRDSLCMCHECTCECHCGIEWLIVGGESGHGARAFDLDWARQAASLCQANGVPVFVKQLGALPMVAEAQWRTDCAQWKGPRPSAYASADSDLRLRLHDRKGGTMEEWPPDLRVRQWPEVRQ